MKTSRHTTIVAGLVCAAAVAPTVAAQQFTSLGVGVIPDSISHDGTIIAGNEGYSAFRWTQATGPVALGGTQASRNWATGMSADGSFLAGNMYDGTGSQVASRWSSFSSWIQIGALSGSCGSSVSTAYDINADGTVVVGLGWVGCRGHAFRWDESGGMIDLGTLGGGDSRANCVSGDGMAVGGWDSDPTTGQWRASVWFSDSRGQVILLPPTPENPNGGGQVKWINSDGTVIVGHSDGTSRRAFRWTATGGVQLLGPGKAVGATEDGAIVLINEGSPPLLPGAMPEIAAIWTEEDGQVGLQQFLADQGINVPTGTPLTATFDITPGGRYIIGRRGIPLTIGSPLEGFLVEMPAGRRYGVNSTASANTLDLSGTGTTSIGGQFQAVTSNITIPAGFLMVQTGAWSFPFFGGELLVDLTRPLAFTAPLAPVGGVATTPINLPPNPAFIGLSLYMQSLAADSAAPLGWAFSNGMKMTVTL